VLHHPHKQATLLCLHAKHSGIEVLFAAHLRTGKPGNPLPDFTPVTAMGWGYTDANRAEAETLQQVRLMGCRAPTSAEPES
jgi:hypothetical protein